MTCDELKSALSVAKINLLTVQVAFSQAQGQEYIDELACRQADPLAPATFTSQTVQNRIAQLSMQQPPNQTLLDLYRKVLADMSAVAVLSGEVIGAQGQVYQIQTQMQQQGCQ